MPYCDRISPQQGEEIVGLGRTSGGSDSPVQESVLSIENVAKMFGVSRFMLRYFEFRGLTRRRRWQDGLWVYTWADCERIAIIVKCCKAGLPMNDIVVVIEATEHDATAAAAKSGQETCMALVGGLERRRRAIDEALSELSHVYSVLTSKILAPNRSTPRD